MSGPTHPKQVGVDLLFPIVYWMQRIYEQAVGLVHLVCKLSTLIQSFPVQILLALYTWNSILNGNDHSALIWKYALFVEKLKEFNQLTTRNNTLTKLHGKLGVTNGDSARRHSAMV